MIPILSHLISFLLPILCYGCLRTPALPESPIPVTPDPCPIPPGTAMIFIRNDVELVNSNLGKADPVQSCATQTGKNDWYNGNTPANYEGSTASAGTWVRTQVDMNTGDTVATCLMPCICDAGGACYTLPDPAAQDPALTLYPHCPTPETCFIAVIFETDGTLQQVVPPTPPNTAPDMYNADGKFNMDGELQPVTSDGYLKAKSIGCGGCPVVVA